MNKWRPFPRNSTWFILASLTFIFASHAAGQQPSNAPATANRSLPQEGIFVVFPFENVGGSPRYDWIGEGLEELTIQRLSSAGQQVYSHAGRLNEMDRSGLPASARPSRATMLHIAQELDADYVVFGSFGCDGKNLTVNARVLRVSPVALLPVVHESGALDTLMDLHTRVVWRLLTGSDRRFPLSLTEFSRLQRPLQLAAFEQFVRGLRANEDEVRLRNLKEAARLEPDWPAPAFALGQFYFQRNDCAAALPWFQRVPATHERSVEAVFSSGVCYLRLHQPAKAEEVFAALQEGLRHNMLSGADLPEILNNLALARSRQGNYPEAQTALGRARDIDPDEDDYPFNLGLLALRANDLAQATTHFREAWQREPDNPEDMAFLIYTLDKQGKKSEAAGERENAVEAFGPNGLPALKLDPSGATLAKFERVKPELDTTSLRLELEGPESRSATRADSSTLGDTPVTHIRRGRQEEMAGRLDLAEKEFRAALTADPGNASAHRELAEILRRRSRLDEAVKELQISLAARDSAATRTALARVYLEQKKPDMARVEAGKAVKLAPNYSEAKDLLERLEKGQPKGGAK